VASGLFRGIPAGGSVGQTALNVAVGAQTRLAVIMAGMWMLLFVLLIPGLVGQAAMAALAALMILAGLGAINLAEARSIWDTGWSSRLPLVVTFVATLFISIPAAVGIGVVLTILLYLFSSSTDVKVREMILSPDGRMEERQPPKQLPSHAVTVLDIHGSLFFAGARTLAEKLPSPQGATQPVVVLRLRGRTRVGATLVEVLDDYADKVEAAGGRLYLSGVEEDIHQQLLHSHKLDLSGPVTIYPATNFVGESSQRAYADAIAWSVGKGKAQETVTNQTHQGGNP
jgi:SulP family sulfate permease